MTPLKSLPQLRHWARRDDMDALWLILAILALLALGFILGFVTWALIMRRWLP